MIASPIRNRSEQGGGTLPWIDRRLSDRTLIDRTLTRGRLAKHRPPLEVTVGGEWCFSSLS